MIPHLLRYQGLAADDYGVAPDALNLGGITARGRQARQRRTSLDFRSLKLRFGSSQ